MWRSLTVVIAIWSKVALANHDGLADGLALVLLLVGAASVLGLVALIATLWLVVRVRRGATGRAVPWCRRLAALDFVLAAAGAILFVVALPSPDAPKLLIPAVAFALVGALAWQTRATRGGGDPDSP